MDYRNIIIMNTSIVVNGRRYFFNYSEDDNGYLVVEADLHGMTKNEAKFIVNGIMSMYSFEFTLVLIHGYNNGTILKDMIQYEINNKRISIKYRYKHNEGVTLLSIKSID